MGSAGVRRESRLGSAIFHRSRPTPEVSTMRLTDFEVLTFDCYGTLIDWESGILAALRPLLSRIGQTLTPNAVLEAFAQIEFKLEVQRPAMKYSDLLAEVHQRLAREWGAAPSVAEARHFGASVPDWPAFADSAGSLQ